MPLEARISCLSPALREAFTDQLDHVEDDTVKEIAVSLLEALADCPDGIPIGLTFHEVEEEQAKARRQRGKATKQRKPSAYQTFVKRRFAEQKGITLEEIAQEWNRQKQEKA